MERPAMLGQTWWLLAIGGAVAILFGIAALLWPGLTLMVFIALFGAYAVIYGVVELVAMFRAISAHTVWWTHLVIGVLSILAGIAAFAYPGMTTATLLYVIAFWAILVGLAEIVAAFVQTRFLLIVTGAIAIMFGLLLLSSPIQGALALVMVIGVFAIVRGVLQLVEAVRAPAATGLLR